VIVRSRRHWFPEKKKIHNDRGGGRGGGRASDHAVVSSLVAPHQNSRLPSRSMPHTKPLVVGRRAAPRKKKKSVPTSFPQGGDGDSDGERGHWANAASRRDNGGDSGGGGGGGGGGGDDDEARTKKKKKGGEKNLKRVRASGKHEPTAAPSCPSSPAEVGITGHVECCVAATATATATAIGGSRAFHPSLGRTSR
jgi:hypothetical protein